MGAVQLMIQQGVTLLLVLHLTKCAKPFCRTPTTRCTAARAHSGTAPAVTAKGTARGTNVPRARNSTNCAHQFCHPPDTRSTQARPHSGTPPAVTAKGTARG